MPGVLVQARVKPGTKKKLAKLAAAGDRKLATYVAIILENHAKSVDLKTMKALERAWRGVKESRDTVVRRKDGPR